MSLVIQAVQQALVSKLSGDALLMDIVTGVYDTVPQRSALPYLVIDQLVQDHVPAIGEGVWQVAAILEVWSEAQGRKIALSTLDRLHTLLHHGALSMSGYQLREMRVATASCELAERATRVVGTIALEMVVAQA